MPEMTKKGKMNCQEKEQVVRIIKATAEQRIRQEVPEIIARIKDKTVKNLASRDSMKKLLSEWKRIDAENDRLKKELDRLDKRIGNLAKRHQCSFEYGKIKDAFPYDFNQRFVEKINNKADEVILRVLATGSSKEAMCFIKELREFRLS